MYWLRAPPTNARLSSFHPVPVRRPRGSRLRRGLPIPHRPGCPPVSRRSRQRRTAHPVSRGWQPQEGVFLLFPGSAPCSRIAPVLFTTALKILSPFLPTPNQSFLSSRSEEHTS